MKDWMKWLLLGLVSVAFGIFALGNAVIASVAVTTMTGILFLFAGGFQIIGGLGAENGSGKIFGFLLGALMAFLGLSFLFNPLEGLISLTLLVLAIVLASGVTRLIFAWRMRQTQYFWPMLISGALSVLLAGYVLANFATIGPEFLGILLGVELLFNGAGLIILSFFMRAVAKNAPK